MRTFVLMLAAVCSAVCAEETIIGWRGNTTGLYPNATPVAEWGRVSKGLIPGMLCSAKKPKGDATNGASKLQVGRPMEWLLLGFLPAPDGPAGLDKDALPNETQVQPDDGEKVGEVAWKPYAVPDDSGKNHFGAVDMPWVLVAQALGGYQPNTVAYAHTYLYSPQDGEVRAVVDHQYGMRAWLNGEEVYKRGDGAGGHGNHYMEARYRNMAYVFGASPSFTLKLKKGWNRLLLKFNGLRPKSGWETMQFNMYLSEPAGTAYEDKNILWAAPLGDRSSGTPIIVGDKIFVMAEPDELICIDKKTGKRLWSRFLDFYHATPEAERASNPAFKEKIEPLAAKLESCQTVGERLTLRKQLYDAMAAIDPEKYGLRWDEHMSSHFRIVGWTMPTPCSDGKNVYVYCGNGVAASFDLDGKPRWSSRVHAGLICYSCAPALMDGKFVLFIYGYGADKKNQHPPGQMVGLDAATGKVVWTQPKANNSTAALVAARFNGVGVIVSQKGDVVRASDGAMLYDHPRKIPNDTGWAPALCMDDTVYLPWSGVNLLLTFDYKGQSGDAWQPKLVDVGVGGEKVQAIKAKGDRWTAGSPLIHNGIYYNMDIYGTVYAVDMKTKQVLYCESLDSEFDYYFHYNSLGVSASITLGGKYLYAMDNQGTTVVFEPGPVFKKVAVNRIGTYLARPWPTRPQEEIGYSPPIFDGALMYLRGENYLYCIGKK